MLISRYKAKTILIAIPAPPLLTETTYPDAISIVISLSVFPSHFPPALFTPPEKPSLFPAAAACGKLALNVNICPHCCVVLMHFNFPQPQIL